MTEYKKCECNADCNLYDSQDEFGECWGDVSLIDETYYEDTGDVEQYHFCEGHANFLYGKEYIPNLLCPNVVIDFTFKTPTREEFQELFEVMDSKKLNE